MIYLNFEEPVDAEWLEWVDKCHAETERLIQSYQDGEPIEIRASLYSEQKHRYNAPPFYGKCAYCESKIVLDSFTRIDHFRPKKGVRDIENMVVTVTYNNEEIPHPGYYWLAYIWQNLLPVCEKCNTWHEEPTGIKVGKGNIFPVHGNYTVSPEHENEEISLLLNPMIEDPKEHIYMDNLGVLHSNPISVKGNISINIFGLNTREELVNGRKKEYDNLCCKIKTIYFFNRIEDRDTEIQKIKEITAGSDSYTIAARKAVEDILNEMRNFQKSLNETL